MTDRTEVEAFRRNTQELSSRAQAQIERLVRSLDLLADPGDVVGTLVEFLPDVVQTYGEAAAAVAADYYETLRETALGADASFATPLAEAAPLEQISASTRWASAPLFGDPIDEAALLGRLRKVTDRLVKSPGRKTLEGALSSDPSTPRFARIPTGRVTCVFCAMLASRGAVYVSRETAGALSDFHDHCDCAITPIFAGQALPAGYNPEHYFDIYKAQGGAGIDLSDRKTRVVTDNAAPAKPKGSRKHEPVGVLADGKGDAEEPDTPSDPDEVEVDDSGPWSAFPKRPLESVGAVADEAEHVNPLFQAGVTTKVGKKEENAYGINCNMCSNTLEMRMRGFDVEALPNDGLVDALNKGEIYDLWNADPTAHGTLHSLTREIENEWPDGGRGFVEVKWSKSAGGGAHIFNVTKVDGKAVFVDAQTATKERAEKSVAWAWDTDFKTSWRPKRGKPYEEYSAKSDALTADFKALADKFNAGDTTYTHAELVAMKLDVQKKLKALEGEYFYKGAILTRVDNLTPSDELASLMRSRGAPLGDDHLEAERAKAEHDRPIRQEIADLKRQTSAILEDLKGMSEESDEYKALRARRIDLLKEISRLKSELRLSFIV